MDQNCVDCGANGASLIKVSSTLIARARDAAAWLHRSHYKDMAVALSRNWSDEAMSQKYALY